jgi:hypothetical protein
VNHGREKTKTEWQKPDTENQQMGALLLAAKIESWVAAKLVSLDLSRKRWNGVRSADLMRHRPKTSRAMINEPRRLEILERWMNPDRAEDRTKTEQEKQIFQRLQLRRTSKINS